MKDKAVITIDAGEIFEVKRIALDEDREGALLFLQKLAKRIDEAVEPK
jgi:hypothetical protein